MTIQITHDDPASDPVRLAVLDSYGVLDTPPEEGFDDVVAIAAEACEAPIALVSLVGADRQWFKARVGLDLHGSDLERSVCRHALVEDDILVIPDLAADARTRDNPFVSGEPHMRFYAGVGLVSPEGAHLGTVCVIDVKPRPEGLTEGQTSVLRSLGRLAMNELELRRATGFRPDIEAAPPASMAGIATSTRDNERKLRLAVAAMGIGTFDLDLMLGMLDWDSRARELLGSPNTDGASGAASILAGVHRDDRDGVERALEAAADPSGDGVFDMEFRTVHEGTGRTTWVSARALAVVDRGRTKHLVGAVRDMTAQVTAEERQRILNRELSHRMKNLMAVVQAIATQTMRSAGGLSEARDVLAERLQALAKAHDVLIDGSSDAAKLSSVIDGAVRVHHGKSDRISISGPDIVIGSKAALPIALMMHELGTNAAKYGALSDGRGRVSVTWDVSGEAGAERVRLSWVERDGPEVLPPSRRGFGTRLIERGLASQMGATVMLEYPSVGASCVLEAPLSRLVEND